MTVRVTATNLATLHAVLDDVWNKPANFDLWWSENLGTILELRLVAKRMLRAAQDVEVEVV